MLHYSYRGAGTGEIHVMGQIGADVRGHDFRVALERLSYCSTINLFVSSSGGDMSETFEINELLGRQRSRTVATIRDRADSAASVIAASCKVVRMAADAQMLIHRPHYPGAEAHEITDRMRDSLREQAEQIARVYERKSGTPWHAWDRLMDDETTLSAARALELGLVDEVIPSYAELDRSARSAKIIRDARLLAMSSRVSGIRACAPAPGVKRSAPRRAALIPEHILDMARRTQARSSGVC